MDNIMDSEVLYAMLDKAFPHKCPTIDMTERAIWMYAGKREMLDIIRAKLDLAMEPPEE
jgi:hypothetical protein